jgi:ferritin
MPLDPRLLEALQEQVNIEAGNSIAYLNLYSRCRASGFEGFSKRWKNEAFDEFGHAQNYVKYIARFDDVCTCDPDSPSVEVAGPKEAASLASQLEQDTEKAIRAAVAVAEEVGDVDAVEYLSGKLVEQCKMSKDARDFSRYVAALAPDTLVLFDRKLENNGGDW